MSARSATLGVLPVALLALACARMGAPPGAPPDFAAPRLLATFPESVVVLDGFDQWVTFQFDEVIDEGTRPNFGTGSGDLEALVLISPDSGVPRVRWRRQRIEVQPRDGWRRNTVYRVELGAGVADLRRNIRDTAAVVTFTTGAPIPTHALRGRAVDWAGRRFVPQALVEATLLPDSLVYRSVTDSSGRFDIAPLPEGEYLVAVVIDANRNRRRDARDPWDTVRVAASQDSVGEIWAFERDSMPPRLEPNGVTRVDSFSIALNLNQPVDPALRLEPSNVTVLLLPDSVPIPVLSALPAAFHDTTYRVVDSTRRAVAAEALARARADSIAAADTTQADSLQTPPTIADTLSAIVDSAPPDPTPTPADTIPVDEPLQDRPVLGSRLVIRIGEALQPGSRYLIEARGIRAAGGAISDTLRGQLSIPAPAPADTTAADSAAASNDSLPAAPDSLPAPVDTIGAAPAEQPATPTNPERDGGVPGAAALPGTSARRR